MGHAPVDIKDFEDALFFNKLPDEIRRMSSRDREWLWVVKKAQELALPEIQRRMS